MASAFRSTGYDPISSKTSKLNQLLHGRLPVTDKVTITREGLVDALLVLYEECSKESLKKNQHIGKFVKKYSDTISELKKLRISINDFEIKNVIGRGHFGEVEVVREKHGGDVYALKVLRKTDMLTQQSVAFYEEERDIMARTNSPWITQLHYAFQDAANLYLVMDFHPGGDLLSLLGRYEDSFEESMARFYLSEMVLAIHTLHTMGYVHRDIKPENILIDRTGHIKLADFGSACRIQDSQSSTDNMPVGTPDYISPEVLELMNSNTKQGKFGEECDWWSLGICMYEMLYGRTPFTDPAGSMVTTYSNIMNYKKTLELPADVEASDSARSLIKGLLTGTPLRLKYDKICTHLFFVDVDFDNVRQTVPPFIPSITSSDDTSNFEEFEKKKPNPTTQNLVSSSGFSGYDLPFIGFTFTKALGGSERPSSSQEVSTPACKASLERRLTAKTKELQDIREKYKSLEHSEAMTKAELDLMKRRFYETEKNGKKAEAERDTLERSIAKYINQIKGLERSLEQERQERANNDAKVMELLDQIRSQAEVAQKFKEETQDDELRECKEMMEQLGDEKMELEKKVAGLRLDLKQERVKLEDKDKTISDLQASLNKYKDSSRTKTQEATAALEKHDAEHKVKAAEMNMKLDQALRQNKESAELIRELREDRTRYEEEIFQLKLSKDTQDNLKRRLTVMEDRRKSLESQMHKIVMLEAREVELGEALANRTVQLEQKEKRIIELEEMYASRVQENKKCERLYSQHEAQLNYKIKDLEAELDKVRDERGSIEEQSLMVFEENEDKMRIIQEHESTISLLKGNVQLLEEQISQVRQEMENEALRGTPRHRSGYRAETPSKRNRRSGGIQTDAQLVSGATQTSFCLPSTPQTTHLQGLPEESESTWSESPTRPTTSPRVRTEVRFARSSDSSTDLSHSDDLKVTVKVKRRSRSHDRETKKRKSEEGLQEDVEDSFLEIDEEEEERIRMLEEKGQEIDDSKTKKNVKTWRQVRRHLEKELSDVEQQKLFLELKVENMQKEVETFKDSSHQQRIRALDLKHELRERTQEFEKQVAELKEKIAKLELAVSEATETIRSLRSQQTSVRERLEKTQSELDTQRTESTREIRSLKETNAELDSKVRTLERKFKMAEEAEKEAKENAYKYEKDLRENKMKVAELSPKCSDLETRLRSALDEKTRFKIDASKYKDEFQEKSRQCDVLTQNTSQLKAICGELEEQLQAFEQLNAKYESKESKWKNEKKTYEKAVDEREGEIDSIHKQLSQEKQNRQRVEQVNEKNKKLHETAEKAYRAEIEHLKQCRAEQKLRIDTLNNQLSQLEHTFSMLEVDHKALKRRQYVSEEECVALKEEITKHITRLSDLKGSNFKLSRNLEEAMERYELLANQRTDLENQLENVQACHNHEKYKLESTIAQQTKLIEYLQDKVENPPKKKRGLFGSKKDQVNASIQFRELQHTLDHERERNAALRQEVLKLKDDLHAARTETIRLKSLSVENLPEKLKSTSDPAGAVLTLSPSLQPSHTTTPRTPSSTRHRRPKDDRMHHKIPHRFISGLNSRATKCAVCLGSVHFVKQASRCQECNMVCHPKCVPELPESCGLPTEYARHFTDVMSQARTTDTKVSVATLKLEMDGWMKMPKSGKQVWEKRYISLRNNTLYIRTSSDPNSEPVEEFNLCPKNGEVTIHSAVTAADLNNTASQDLPYILRLEFEPNTTCWPGRVLYVMAISFPEKQKWVATLEAIINHSGKEENVKDVKVLGNPMFKSNGSNRLEVNCSTPLSDQMILLGADEGLFSMQLQNDPDSRPLTKLQGMENVQMLDLVPGLGLLLAVTGTERDLVSLEVRAVQQCLARTSQTSLHKPTVRPRSVPGANGCTTFAVSSQSDGIYLCVATADRLLLYKYNNRKEEFTLRKELATSEPCSCMTFCQDFVIVGTDRFYSINLHDYSFNEFLDKTDSSLAFAAFGAARYHSFPIAVLRVSPPSELEEFLLCFNEFGVFVHSSGRKSRSFNMKWSGLPLSFAFQAPYLYVVYFNTLQVVEIPTSCEQSQTLGGRKFLNIVNPRYLGPALMPSAVYIASLKENDTEIICFKGNMGGKEVSDKENVVGARVESEMDYSSEDSPMRIRKMSNSPGRSLSHKKTPRLPGHMTSTDSETDVGFGADQTNRGEVYQRGDGHRTVTTLDRFLKEQSVRRRAPPTDDRSVSGLRGVFEQGRHATKSRTPAPGTSSDESSF